MPQSPFLQLLIHKLTGGAGSRYQRYIALMAGVLALAMLYDLRAYQNLATVEAMDSAQLARNLAEGRGYTTFFLRPFSLYLMQQQAAAHPPDARAAGPSDPARIQAGHPDLYNPPVYPLALAGLMKVLPFDYAVNLKKPFWKNKGMFWRYQPDFFIALFNQALLLLVVGLTFFLAKNLFGSEVAWMAALLVLGCELLWRFSVSGLSTLLLLTIFLGLTLVLLKMERAARESPPRPRGLLMLAIALGVLTGLGALTQYAFGWTLIPVLVFLFFFSGPGRSRHVLAALAAFLLVLTPWILRNEVVSGTPLGAAGYAVVEGTGAFPQFQLERSVHPELGHALRLNLYMQKFFGNLRGILTGDLLKTAGGWVFALFFVGLFLRFRGTSIRRLRYFLLMCLAVFVVVQALGRTQLSELSPEINSENLLVLLVPLMFIFGVSVFFTLLEGLTLPLAFMRPLIIAGFAALACLPLVFTLLLPSKSPVVYPPYFPPKIQQCAGWMQPEELMMSDVPWAVAWYGQRQCLWLTLDAQDDFFAVNALKPVRALYLTPLTMDGKFVSEWMRASKRSWGQFVLQTLIDKQVPDLFPLAKAPEGFLPDQLFLTDRQRWETQ